MTKLSALSIVVGGSPQDQWLSCKPRGESQPYIKSAIASGGGTLTIVDLQENAFYYPRYYQRNNGDDYRGNVSA